MKKRGGAKMSKAFGATVFVYFPRLLACFKRGSIMNARTFLTLAFAAIAFGSLAQAAEDRSVPVAIDDHFYLLNSSGGHEGLVSPTLEADAKVAGGSLSDSAKKMESRKYASFSATIAKNRESKAAASAKPAQSSANIPPLWVGIMCAGAGVGLTVIVAAVWQRHRVSRRDWMSDESEGRILYQRWARSSVPTILASKLIEVQRSSVKSPAVIVNPEETRELRRAA
jgi:hypothetical protein